MLVLWSQMSVFTLNLDSQDLVYTNFSSTTSKKGLSLSQCRWYSLSSPDPDPDYDLDHDAHDQDHPYPHHNPHLHLHTLFIPSVPCLLHCSMVVCCCNCFSSLRLVLPGAPPTHPSGGTCISGCVRRNGLNWT